MKNAHSQPNYSILFYIVIIYLLSAFGQDSFHVSEAQGKSSCPRLPSDVARFLCVIDNKRPDFSVIVSLKKRFSLQVDLGVDSRTRIYSWQSANKSVSRVDWLNERSCGTPILNHQS